MQHDVRRLVKLRDELRALRAICKNEFVIKSIDEVLADIRMHLDGFDPGDRAAIVAFAEGRENVSPLG